MQKLSACPVCQQTNLAAYLSCKDHIVSHETFHLQRCESCGFVFTNPRPDESHLPAYYRSDAYVSHSNKSNNAINLIYKISRTFTLRWKYDLILRHSISKTPSVLDYGCGTGDFLAQCLTHQLKVAGVEPSPEARTEATKKTNAEIRPDIEDVAGPFDIITLWHVLEHVPDLDKTLQDLKERLSKNGTIFIAVPNRNSRDAQEYREHWAAYDVPRHLWHFSKPTMKKLLAHHNLKITDILPMPLDAYYVCLLSEKYLKKPNGIAGIPRAILRGWKSNHSAQKTGEYSSLIYLVRK